MSQLLEQSEVNCRVFKMSFPCMMDQGFVMVEHWISDWHQPFGFLSCSQNLKCEKVLWPEDATVYLFFFTTVSSVCCHLFPLFILGIKAEQSLLLNATWVLQPMTSWLKWPIGFHFFKTCGIHLTNNIMEYQIMYSYW